MSKTRRFRKTKSSKTLKGGKTFATDKNLKLTYNDNEVNCDICKNNSFKETIGAFEKSKVRSGVGQAFFGHAAAILDTTSVIIYTCNTCGLCKIIRNKDPIKVISKEI
jgi:hypothetical protein